MPGSAILIYSDDSAHRPDETGATSAEIAVCDEHALELASQAVMTSAWAFTPRDMARAVRAEAVTDGPYVDSPQVVAGVLHPRSPRSRGRARSSGHENPVLHQGGGLEVRPIHSGGPVEPSQG